MGEIGPGNDHRRLRFGGLWRHADFLRLWAGQTISEFGSWLGALPLLAILVLDAGPAQMGLLETLRSAPAMLVGLFAGVWVDRTRRRPLLVSADLARALLLLLVVLLAFSGLLRMTHLYLVVVLLGSLTVVFNLAYHAYVPTLVQKNGLLEANSKLGASSSLAEIASPGLGGFLVELISAPLTLLIDALSFLLSALFIGRIASPEAGYREPDSGPGIWPEIKTGLRLTLAHPLLRSIAAASGTRSFFGGFFAALYGLFVLREVGLSPAVLGMLIGAGGIGSFFGALLTGRFVDQFGWGNALILASLVSGLFALLIPLAGGKAIVAVAILLISQLLGDLFLTIYFIGELSLRQSITPDLFLGRINASFEFLVGGIGTVGILVGGLVGQVTGLRLAITAGAMGLAIAFLWLFFSPVRGLTNLGPWKLRPIVWNNYSEK